MQNKRPRRNRFLTLVKKVKDPYYKPKTTPTPPPVKSGTG